MPNEIPIPADLNHLIEKREAERRVTERRNQADQETNLANQSED